MKKKYLVVLLFCLIKSVLIAQTYQVRLENITYKASRNVKNRTDSHLEIRLVYKDNTHEILYYRDIRDGTGENNLDVGPFIVNKQPARLHIGGFINFSDTYNARWNENIDLSSGCLERKHYVWIHHGGGLNPNLSFDYSSRPIVNISQPINNLVGYNDTFDISVNQANSIGFNTSMYNWQYQVIESGTPSDNHWIDMPTSTQGKPNFSINPSSFLTKADINKRIYFRIQMCDKLVSENVIFYNLRLSAPHITSRTTTRTTCYDTEDGTAKLKFDRPLKKGESLSISVQNTTTGLDYSVSNIPKLDANNTYTLKGLPIGNYKASLLGFYKGFNTYVQGTKHKTSFTITRPNPVKFTTSKVDVWCEGGSDGEISIAAQGGVGNYEYTIRNKGDTTENWQPFSAASAHTITGLAPATYEILVRDANGCYAKEVVTNASGKIIGLADIVVQTIDITQPDDPVDIDYVFSQEPTAFGFSNGIIKAQITGGTPIKGGNYDYTWVYEDGTVWRDITEEVVKDQGYFLTLNNAVAGIYKLTVTDKNYNNATDKQGCTVNALEFELTQPDPLEVELSVDHEISCHQNNEFGNETDTTPKDGQRDESQDGALIARVTGGVPFASGAPYIYSWKKQLADGSWQTLTGQTKSVADLLSDGNYAFNVEDANGIILGNYKNNALVQAVDSLYYLHEPSKLEVSLTSTPTTCASGADGSLTATVTGGTPPYTYYWSNGQVGAIPTIENLSPNNYFVQITDAKACQVQASTELAQPENYYIELVELKNPTCYAGNDGKIDITIHGGTAPYTINWSNKAITEDIENLSEGKYAVSVTDASGCMLHQEFTIENPEQVTIDLGEDRTLCNGQTVLLDAGIADPNAIYEWTADNGLSATDSEIEVAESGIYRVTATTSLGCMAKDQITITTSNEDIDSEFLLSSQAYVSQEVVLVNISNPKGETTHWLIPSEVTINEQSDNVIKLVFPEAATYKIGLRSTEGDCYEEFYKNIVVEEPMGIPDPGDTEHPFIKEFIVAPNPHDGNFRIRVKLAEASPISIRIFSMLGERFVATREESGSDRYTVYYNEFLPAGGYLVVLETAKGTQVKKMISF